MGFIIFYFLIGGLLLYNVGLGSAVQQHESAICICISVTRVYVPRFFVLSQQRFGVTDIKAPSACHSSQVLDRLCYNSQVLNEPCYSSYTNQRYSSILFRRQQENPSSRHEGTLIQRHKEKSTPARRRERELALAPLFICLSLPGPVLCKLGQPGVLFV